MITQKALVPGLATLVAALLGSFAAPSASPEQAGARLAFVVPDAFAARANTATATATATSPATRRTPVRCDAEALIDARGGVVSSGRVAIFVPAGAVSSPTVFRIAESKKLPGAFPRGVHATSPVVELTKDRKGSFKVPVRVTIPCTDESSQAFYWEPSRRKYEAVTVLGRTETSIAFQTAHFTEFVAASGPENSVTNDTSAPSSPFTENSSGIPMDELRAMTRTQLDDGTLALHTGFDPARDGVPFINMGDHDNDGNCFGMANVAIWFYGERRRQDQLARDGDDYTSSALALSERFDGSETSLHAWTRLAQDDGDNEGRRNYQSIWSGWSGPDHDGMRREARDLLTRMAATNSPQLLSIMDGGSGHVIVVYGYEDGHFLVYDPNFPGQTMFYEFDGHDFGDYTHSDGEVIDRGIYDSIDGIESHQLSDSFSDEDMRELLDRSRTDEAQERYAAVSVTEVRRNADGTTTVTGTISGSDDAREHADLADVVRPGTGRILATSEIHDGRFTITVRESVSGPLVLNVVEEDGSYTGSTSITIPAPPPPPPSRTTGLGGALGAALGGGVKRSQPRSDRFGPR